MWETFIVAKKEPKSALFFRLYNAAQQRIFAYLLMMVHNHNDGSKRIADNALVAMTLMIAESNPKHKDTIAKVIVNLINKKN